MQKTHDFTLIKKYNLDVKKIKFNCNFDLNLDLTTKTIILQKLLEAKEIAILNVKKGNITRRAFGANVLVESAHDRFWTLGTNFNNTRNDISSMCAERSAVIGAYNRCLNKKIKDFKIRYIAMAQALELDDINERIFPCEDCLSWFNTTRLFDNDTLIFVFERKNNELTVNVSRLDELLPYRGLLTSNKIASKIKYTSMAKGLISDKEVLNLLNRTKKAYEKNELCAISNQNIASGILANKKIYTSHKIDWTRRWFIEPLELCMAQALEKEKNLKVKAIAYFGDELAKTNQGEFLDGVVSIKSLGRLRQKYTTDDTVLILNFEDKTLVMKLSEYLPNKFVQGYKIN